MPDTTPSTEEKGIRVRRSPEFKLKAKVNRNIQALHLSSFGFVPETIIMERVIGKHNLFTINAVLTPEEIKKMDKFKVNDNNTDTITN